MCFVLEVDFFLARVVSKGISFPVALCVSGPTSGT